MNEIKIKNEIYLQGITPKSTNNLFDWYLSNNQIDAIKKGDKKGQRAARAVKSWQYRKWRKLFIDQLPANFILPNSSNLHLYIEVGVFKEFDLDNTLKAIIDGLQIKYSFNDNEITYLVCRKNPIGTFDAPEPAQHYIKICLLEEFSIGEAVPADRYLLDITQNTIEELDRCRDWDRLDRHENKSDPNSPGETALVIRTKENG
jgi:hypothetical protein